MVNTHVHLPPNFSAFETAEDAVETAAAEGVRVVGASNFHDPRIYARFADAARAAGIVPLNGITWPTSGIFAGFRITFRAGFADRLGSPQQDADVVPVRFKQAMKLWAEANYDRDPIMMPLLLKVAEQLVKPERADLQIA